MSHNIDGTDDNFFIDKIGKISKIAGIYHETYEIIYLLLVYTAGLVATA